MQYIYGLLIVIHLIGFATLTGATLALLPSAKKGKGFVPEMMLHGVVIIFLSGVFLIALALAQGGLSNVAAVIIKIVVMLALVVMIISKRKVNNLRPGFFGAILGLTVFSVAISIIW